jgi:hypothetical protein
MNGNIWNDSSTPSMQKVLSIGGFFLTFADTNKEILVQRKKSKKFIRPQLVTKLLSSKLVLNYGHRSRRTSDFSLVIVPPPIGMKA